MSYKIETFFLTEMPEKHQIETPKNNWSVEKPELSSKIVITPKTFFLNF